MTSVRLLNVWAAVKCHQITSFQLSKLFKTWSALPNPFQSKNVPIKLLRIEQKALPASRMHHQYSLRYEQSHWFFPDFVMFSMANGEIINERWIIGETFRKAEHLSFSFSSDLFCFCPRTTSETFLAQFPSTIKMCRRGWIFSTPSSVKLWQMVSKLFKLYYYSRKGSFSFSILFLHRP